MGGSGFCISSHWSPNSAAWLLVLSQVSHLPCWLGSILAVSVLPSGGGGESVHPVGSSGGGNRMRKRAEEGLYLCSKQVSCAGILLAHTAFSAVSETLSRLHLSSHSPGARGTQDSEKERTLARPNRSQYVDPSFSYLRAIRFSFLRDQHCDARSHSILRSRNSSPVILVTNTSRKTNT